jgi:signal transduction histidine kinase
MKPSAFTEIVDVNLLQQMANYLYKATKIPIGILDIESNEFVVKTGWQDICLNFHRAHPDSCARCQESDSFIKKNLNTQKNIEYKCKNGMWDNALPLVINNQHIATIFMGQYFYDDEQIDYAFFEKQAAHFGYNKEKYLEALNKVPVFSREWVDNIMNYYNQQIKVMAYLGHLKLEAEESNRLKTAFLANISHELRTPLNGIIGFSDLLISGKYKKEDVSSYAKIINTNGNLLLELVNNIIDVSLIESGLLKFKKSPFNLEKFINEIHDFFQFHISEKNLNFNNSYTDNCKNVTLYEDESKLKQVVYNLISNAIKYTEKGSIELFFNLVDNRLFISIKDTGCGIPKDIQKSIFERFYQASEQSSGSGIGLSIIKGIVDNMGGELKINSQYLKGSEFIIEVPVRVIA